MVQLGLNQEPLPAQADAGEVAWAWQGYLQAGRPVSGALLRCWRCSAVAARLGPRPPPSAQGSARLAHPFSLLPTLWSGVCGCLPQVPRALPEKRRPWCRRAGPSARPGARTSHGTNALHGPRAAGRHGGACGYGSPAQGGASRRGGAQPGGGSSTPSSTFSRAAPAACPGGRRGGGA